MASTTHAQPPLRWDGQALHVLDQTLLPAREQVLVLRGADDTAEAIARLAVRGAPLIGVAAAYGLAMAVARDPASLDAAADRLARARPTARNLAWAVERVRAAAHEPYHRRPIHPRFFVPTLPGSLPYATAFPALV